jgi:hypothetical protein
MYIPFDDGEVLLAKVHRHWVFIALRIAALGLFLLIPLPLTRVLSATGTVEFVASGAAIAAMWAMWALVAWLAFWQFWTTYYMDVWVVTNRRIIDIDYLRLFERNIAMLRLDRVQDVTTEVKGIFGTLLRYGSVVVQSAGSDREFVIDQIANPEQLRDVILAAAGKESERMRTVRLE